MDSNRASQAPPSFEGQRTTEEQEGQARSNDTEQPRALQTRQHDNGDADRQLAPLDQEVVGAPGQEEQQATQRDNGRGGAPAVRLDMDLDVDVQLKAKIQGDITLSILEGDQKGG